jgi:hypothetical protein
MSEVILQQIHDEQVEQGKTLAAIDERTKQHEKRMDRSDRKAAGISGAGGLFGGALVVFVKSFFPGGGT